MEEKQFSQTLTVRSKLLLKYNYIGGTWSRVFGLDCQNPSVIMNRSDQLHLSWVTS